jgi:amphi-Trp domain-containing protein
MEKTKLTVTQSLEFTEATAYLEALLQSFKTGTILVSQGEDSLELTPAPIVDVEVEAKVKKGRQKFSLELEWEETAEQPLVISGAASKAVSAESGQSEPAKEVAAVPAAKAAPSPAPVAEKAKLVETGKPTKGKTEQKPASPAAAGKGQQAASPGSAAKGTKGKK